jgi:hypothetical protein
MDLLIEKYGIYGIIVYFVIKEVWPFFRDKFFPEKMKAAELQETRLALAIENVGVAMKAMGEAVVVQNERLTHLANQQEEHIRVSNEAVMAMMIKTKTMPRKRKPVPQ